MIPGIYKGKPVEAVLAQTEKGVEYIGVTFEVCEGEFAGSCVTTQMWWTPKAEGYTKATLAKLGWDGGVKTIDGQAHLTLPPVAVAFAVKEDTYNGRTSLKVDWVVSPPAGVKESDKLTGKQAANLLARIKGEPQQRSNGYAAGRGNGYQPTPREEYGPGADEPGF